MNVASHGVAGSTEIVPGTVVVPWRSCIVAAVSVPTLIGWLNTATSEAFSGTSRLSGGGSVRTTTGGITGGTATVKESGEPVV